MNPPGLYSQCTQRDHIYLIRSGIGIARTDDDTARENTSSLPLDDILGQSSQCSGALIDETVAQLDLENSTIPIRLLDDGINLQS